jgi:uncharacterized membrane protein YvlD (DUF360 family)
MSNEKAQPANARGREGAGEPPRRRPILRVLIIWLLSAGTLLLLSASPSAVKVSSPAAALAAAALIGLINALIWPVVLRFALGLGVVVINGAIVLLVSSFELGLYVPSLLAGIGVALAITIVTTAVASVLAVDDEGFWYRNVVRRYQKRVAPTGDLEHPGLFFLEIDGLAHDVLARAIRDGNVPTLARWLRDGSHELTEWETDWSSQTGACQAGLLHGSNEDMPAFRWWEKDRGAAIVTNHPRDAMEIERRRSNGRGLLFADGASRANILSGDAPHSQLTMSTALARDRHGRIGQDYFAYFANPYNVIRTIALVAREVVSELWSAHHQRRLDIVPRIHRGFTYALVRAWATVIQRDLQVTSIIADMYAGRPVAYTTFLGYDEVAHHSGIERPETLATLRAIDHSIARIAAAERDAPREYRFVVLSDHGQSQGATFLDRYGLSLEDLVESVTSGGVAGLEGDPSEALGFIGASLTEASAGDSAMAGAVRRASGLKKDGHEEVHLGADTVAGGEGEQPPPVVVMASGCLGLISFPREPGRLSLERISELHPSLINTLREHAGIGFLLVRSDEHGAVVLGGAGANYLDEGRVEGDDPLAPFGPRAAQHVKRTDGFEHCPDIVLNSTYWTAGDEVAAFEELVGSHGGMGGTQSHPFLLHPCDLELPEQELVGAEHVHRYLRRWLVALGYREYDQEAGGDGEVGAAGLPAAPEAV